MHSDIFMSPRRGPDGADVGLASYDLPHEGSQARLLASPASDGGPPGATRTPRAATDLGALGVPLQRALGGALGPEARRAEAGRGRAAVALSPGHEPAGSGGAGGSARGATLVGCERAPGPRSAASGLGADTRESVGAPRAPRADDEAYALEVATVVEQVALGHMGRARLTPYLVEDPEGVARAARVAGVVFNDEVNDDVAHEAAMAVERAREVAARAQDVARARRQASARALEKRRAGVRPRARAGRRPRARRARRRAARARADGDDPAPGASERLARGLA